MILVCKFLVNVILNFPVIRRNLIKKITTNAKIFNVSIKKAFFPSVTIPNITIPHRVSFKLRKINVGFAINNLVNCKFPILFYIEKCIYILALTSRKLNNVI